MFILLYFIWNSFEREMNGFYLNSKEYSYIVILDKSLKVILMIDQNIFHENLQLSE